MTPRSILFRHQRRMLQLLAVVGIAALIGVVSIARANSFTSGARWNDFFCIGDEVCRVGDFNGDGKDDIAAFVRSTQTDEEQGDVYVALSDGDAFRATNDTWQDFFCINNEVCEVGDFNGDGKDDIVTFLRDTQDDDDRGDVYVAFSDGGKFGDGMLWQGAFCTGNQLCTTGDADGDGRSDAVAFVRSSLSGGTEGDVYVALSTKADYLPPRAFIPLVQQREE